MTKRNTFYDTIAADFDQIMNQYEIEKRLRLIFTELLPEPLDGLCALDMGCGTGWFTLALAARGADVISSDIGLNLLLETRRKYSGGHLAVNSLEALGFAANTFDVIICTEVIEHTPDPRASVHELMRVLKPGGILALTVPNRLWLFSVTVANWLKIRPYYGYENWVWLQQLQTWVPESGGIIERTIGFNLLPLFYRPFYRLLDFADEHLSLLSPLMVNIGIRVRKGGE